MTFASQLRAHRARLGLSQAALAKLLDVKFQTYAKWEREVSAPPAQITVEGALARLKALKPNQTNK